MKAAVLAALAVLAVLGTGCTFEAPQGAPTNLVLGAPCGDDRDCASHVCGAITGSAMECIECRAGTPCPTGRVCDVPTGRCLPSSMMPRHVGTAGGDRSRNAEGRVHVGRVGVVPVSSVTESPP